MDEIILNPIGIIKTPYNSPKDMPIQPTCGRNIKANVIIYDEYKDGLKDLCGFTYIFLIYQFHLISSYSLIVTPFMDTEEHGIFATRSPKRPNKLGISIVKLINIKDNVLEIEDIDIVNDTPLIDIKPYFQQFDIRNDGRAGWLDKNKELSKKEALRSDERFIK